MQEKELISIIVPVYNVEKYLEKCLKSLQNQSYRKLEIIMINDGSTDGSAEICRKFCGQDDRFLLLEQENKGLGKARNAGLDAASGSWICFVDSDDYVHERYVEVLYQNVLRYQADISMCGYVKFEDGTKPEGIQENIPRMLEKKQMILDISTVGPQNRSEPMVVSWNKLIRAELLQDLRFVDKIHEDEFMILEYLMRTERIVWTDASLYFYRQHSLSIMGSENKMDLRHLALLEALELRVKAFSGREYHEVFRAVLCSYFENATILYLLMEDCGKKSYLMKKIYPSYLKMLLRYGGRLGKRRFFRYAFFLAAPNQYRKKYWDP